MRRRLLAARHQVLLGLIIWGAIAGMAIAEPRLGGEDWVFSYSPEKNRVVFGGPTYSILEYSNAYHPDASALYMQDLKTGVKTKIFEAQNGTVGNPMLSSSGQFVAVQLFLRQEGALVSPNKLLVLTAEGKEIAAFDQTRDFAWSPNSRFLAYTVGEWGGIDTFHSSGTWLYDLTLRTARKVADQGDFVAWSFAGESLLIWSRSSGVHVFRYDPSIQKITETNLHGIFFSPTGRYYHSAIPRFNEGGVEVYDAQSNQPMLRHRPRLDYVVQPARIVGWASEGDVLLLEVNRQDLVSKTLPHGRLDTVLYDVANDIARVIEDDSVIGWQHGHVIVHDRGKFTKRAVTSLPLLPDHPEKPTPPAAPRRP